MPPESGDGLLPHYLAELAYLHSAGAEFARAYPQVAEALALSAKGSTDPHVERLIESFAFLTARLQRTYDAEFPEIPAALLGVLYPQLVAPVPSMAIASFLVDPERSRAAAGVTVPAGTALFALASAGGRAAGRDELACRFRTGHKLTLWPIEVADASLEPRALYPFLDDKPGLQDVLSVLRLRLRCLGRARFGEFSPSSLRFFLPPRSGTGDALYELLFTSVRGIALAPSGPETAAGAGPAPAAKLSDARIAPVGFAADEALLPSLPSSHQGYRLLQEYFTFPDKFLFFDIAALPEKGFGSGAVADIFLLLTAAPESGIRLSAASFALNCTPMINLFSLVSEPIRLDQTKVEYRLVADSRRESSTEIHSIQRVTRSRAEGGPAETVRPLFSFSHADWAAGRTAMYYTRRQPISHPDFEGNETLISFVDPDLNPSLPAADTVFAHVTCTNRGLAEQIGEGTPLHREIDLPVNGVFCMMRPTRQVPPPAKGGTLWRLVSHLSVNHLSIGGADGLAALREILLLYATADDAARHRLISGLTRLATRRVVRHIGSDAWRGFCRGFEVELEFDEQGFPGAGAYLMGSVLSRFLGLYAAVDSFTELVMRNRRTEHKWRWPARTGDAILL
jgi:type VI secretion system protein ImpG